MKFRCASVTGIRVIGVANQIQCIGFTIPTSKKLLLVEDMKENGRSTHRPRITYHLYSINQSLLGDNFVLLGINLSLLGIILYSTFQPSGCYDNYDNWQFRTYDLAVACACYVICSYANNELYYSLRQDFYATQWRNYMQIYAPSRTNSSYCPIGQ